MDILSRVHTKSLEIFNRYRGSRLLQSGSWYLVAAGLQRGLNFFAVYLFSHLLSTEEYGTVSIFLPWLTILASTITLNVYTAIPRAKFDFSGKEFEQFLSAAITLGLISSLTALILSLLVPENLILSVLGLSKSLLILAILTTTTEISLNSALAIWQVEYNYRMHSYVSLLLAASRIVVSWVLIITVFQAEQALGRILGITLISLVAGTYFTAYFLARGKKLFQPSYYLYALGYSLPLIPHVLSGLILAQFDRLLIDRYVGRGEAGLYSLAYQVGEIVTLIWSATNMAWVPWFYEQMGKKNYQLIRRRANHYLILFTGITVLLILIGPWLLTILAPEEYWITRSIVPIIMASMFFNLTYAFYASTEFFEKQTAYISIGTALSAVINVGLNIIFLPRFGYSFAAWTTLASYILLFLFHAVIVIFRLRLGQLFNFSLMMILGALIIGLSTAMFLFNS